MNKGISSLFAEEETMRCLLCYDAPCSKACPAGTNPAKFIRSLRFKNEDGAINTIRNNNPFGASCSELCNSERYCEKACIRSKIDEPVKIKYLQKYVMNKEESVKKEVKERDIWRTVYILGADIKGLSAGVEFAKENYKVVVFDNKDVHKYISEDVDDETLSMLNKDIISILNRGIEIRKEIPALWDLEKDSFDILLLASDDVQDINFFDKKFKSKVYYLDKMVRGPKDFVYSIKKGKECARKIIEEERRALYEQAES